MCRHSVYVATTASVISGNASFKRRSVAMTTSARQSARPRPETTAGSVGSCSSKEIEKSGDPGEGPAAKAVPNRHCPATARGQRQRHRQGWRFPKDTFAPDRLGRAGNLRFILQPRTSLVKHSLFHLFG